MRCCAPFRLTAGEPSELSSLRGRGSAARPERAQRSQLFMLPSDGVGGVKEAAAKRAPSPVRRRDLCWGFSRETGKVVLVSVLDTERRIQLDLGAEDTSESAPGEAEWRTLLATLVHAALALSLLQARH